MEYSDGLLLVEDDAATRELLSLLLAGDGWQVHGTETGEDALAWLDTAPAAPHVVLCDQRLPGMCGTPLAHALQAALHSRFQSHDTVLLAMTATAGRSTPAGYAQTLLKPFPATSVRAALSGSRPINTQCGAVKYMQPAATDMSPAQALPVLDETTLTQLRRSMPARQLQELFAFAIADAGDRVERMQRFSQEDGHDAFVREAHSLKGSFGVIGAAALRQVAGDAEHLSSDAASFASLSQKKVESLHSGLEQLRLMLVTLFPV